MAQRFFELDKNSFSRYLGRGVCFAIELSHSSWNEKYYLINNTKPLIIPSNDFTFEYSTNIGQTWYGIAYGNGRFVAVGSSGKIATTQDENNWGEPIQLKDNTNWLDIAYGNGRFVAIGANGSTKYVVTSTDGINWTDVDVTLGLGATGIVYVNNLFIAMLQNRYIATSTDGINWNAPIQVGGGNYNAIAYSDNKYVSVGSNGYTSTSTDGATWTAPVQISSREWQNVTYGNGLFVAISYNYVTTSTDGITWTTPVQIGETVGTTSQIFYVNNKFVAITDSYIITSTDGVNWNNKTDISISNNDAIYEDDKYIVVGSSGAISVLINGTAYQPYPFDIVLPAQTEQQGTQIVFSNIQNLAANLVRQTVDSNENITLQLYVVNVESETAERYDKGLFEIFNPQITSEAVQANINLRHSFDINCGSMRYNRQLFPNLFL